MDFKIVFEDKSILVALKPAGLPAQPDKTGDRDLLTLLQEALQTSEPLRVVHRLDRPVGGLLVYAKTQQAAASLSKQIAKGTLSKRYMAVVCGKPEKGQERLTDYLLKNARLNCSKVVPAGTKGAKEAILSYEAVASLEMEKGKMQTQVTLLNILLYTGRHHQIRAQLANASLPIWGDGKYGGRAVKKDSCIALWANALSFTHPLTGEVMHFTQMPFSYPFNLFLKEDTKAVL